MNFPSWSVIFGFVIGAVIGSFLNMAIYRLPRKLSFVNPSKSFCPKCKHPLEAIDLFPLLSWASTGGKCRYCKEPIAVRYFLVELLLAILFTALWYQFLVAGYEPLKCGFYMLETAGLVAVIFIDWELYIIPDELNAYLLIVAVIYRALDHTLLQGLEGGLMGWGLLWGIAFLGRIAFGKDAMGHGDIKMMRGIGFLLGMALTTASLGMAVVLGLVFGLAMIAYSKLRKVPEPETTEDEIGEEYKPESIGSLLKLGAWYLLCLDVVALPFPKLYKVIGEEVQEDDIDDETWKPSLTTIPFGPYLAAGAIACMLFAGPIMDSISTWWHNSTDHSATNTTSLRIAERIDPDSPSHCYGKSIRLNKVEPTCLPSGRVGYLASEPIIADGRQEKMKIFDNTLASVAGNIEALSAVENQGDSGVCPV